MKQRAMDKLEKYAKKTCMALEGWDALSEFTHERRCLAKGILALIRHIKKEGTSGKTF